jgi:WD40 repeat protein
MDISSDSTLLASGSADKNLKIWGLDFGDCHRSLFAHGDSVMAVAFQPNTHYVFTASERFASARVADAHSLTPGCVCLLDQPGNHVRDCNSKGGGSTSAWSAAQAAAPALERFRPVAFTLLQVRISW